MFPLLRGLEEMKEETFRINLDLTITQMIDLYFWIEGLQLKLKKNIPNYKTCQQIIKEIKRINDSMALDEAYWANESHVGRDYVREYVLK
jgi:hypothetical protein